MEHLASRPKSGQAFRYVRPEKHLQKAISRYYTPHAASTAQHYFTRAGFQPTVHRILPRFQEPTSTNRCLEHQRLPVARHRQPYLGTVPGEALTSGPYHPALRLDITHLILPEPHSPNPGLWHVTRSPAALDLHPYPFLILS